MKNLIVVESPAKIKTIQKFLGDDYKIMASYGHIRDLAKAKLGINEETFEPNYIVMEDKQRTVSALRKAASECDTIYLAADPDREGESIAYHVNEVIKSKVKNPNNIKRITFNEITKNAVIEAIKNSRQINIDLFKAQETRRMLDRLVGFKISPLLWKMVKKGLSAGRVQSVALKLIVEKEEERNKFIPEEYWSFKVVLSMLKPPHFKAELIKVDGKKAHIKNEEEANIIRKILEKQDYIVSSVDHKPRLKSSPLPFTTSTLQQVASTRLNFQSKRTMMVAQKLYEGAELGSKGMTALITYMRTDSTRVSDEARKACIQYIATKYGPEYLGEEKVVKNKDHAQDAHEAIRPVDVTITPDSIKEFLPDEQYKLYNLIWCRFVASFMSQAKFSDTKVEITCVNTTWLAKGEVLQFPGFLKVMGREEGDDSDKLLPVMAVDDKLEFIDLLVDQKWTSPPNRYTEASLVKALEENGIGRPSTYASIISTLLSRSYVTIVDKCFVPNPIGTVVCTKLRKNFIKLMDTHFTAQMENDLDKIALGQLDNVKLLKEFNTELDATLKQALINLTNDRLGDVTDVKCPLCQNNLVIKMGRTEQFLGCSNYPNCKFTSAFTRDNNDKITLVAKQQSEREVAYKCPECNHDVYIRRSRKGTRFYGCSNYPNCSHTKPFVTTMKCSKNNCNGNFIERSDKKGRTYWICNNPDCNYSTYSKQDIENSTEE